VKSKIATRLLEQKISARDTISVRFDTATQWAGDGPLTLEIARLRVALSQQKYLACVGRITAECENTATPRTSCGKAMRWLESMSNHSADECLAYPFLINAQGYGYIGNAEKKGTSLASRIMCILAHGNPPHKDSYACHSCHKGNQGCVNPRHLYWGDNRSNQMDRVDNENSNRGSRHGCSKLSKADVLEIRANLSGKSVVEMAAERGLAVSTIYAILSRHTWAWL